MRKFLVVGCGGSGGTTLRLMMDQLKADLRKQGVPQLPVAWQFVHIDARVGRDRGPDPLGDIIDLGGSYIAVTHNGNSYSATANNVEHNLGTSDSPDYAPLLGWAPRDKAAADGIPVTSGAGQYRAVGRMLTLPHLGKIRSGLLAAQARMMDPKAWGGLEAGTDEPPTAIVVASMAGGSGASMFLDVCRILGTIPGISAPDIGCFLYTADVFAELTPDQRANIEGNAMAAITESIAATTMISDVYDRRTLEAFGLTGLGHKAKPFGRVFPIGRRIGGDGALFGDGSQLGVYRGVARALAGLLMSTDATRDYVDFFVGNPSPPVVQNYRFGWRSTDRDLPFGAMGYASLSLGRDRYVDYASQRISRAAVDHLLAGHINPTNPMPSTEVLARLLDNQGVTSYRAMGLPEPGQPMTQWFQTTAFPQQQWQAAAREGLAPGIASVGNVAPAAPTAWVHAARGQLAAAEPVVVRALQRSAYVWAESWAAHLEAAAKAEFLRTVGAFGLPYARELMSRCRLLCDTAVTELSAAGGQAGNFSPVEVDAGVGEQAARIGNQMVTPTHALRQMLVSGLAAVAERRLRLEAATLAAEVLRSFAESVLGALSAAANDELRALEHAKAQPGGGAGLAQLNSSIYADWPGEDGVPPQRFDHAMNEVLLTTSADFPGQFSSDVAASGGQGAVYSQGLTALRSQVILGRWETVGSTKDYQVVQQSAHWRPPVLTVNAADGVPTPQSDPRYRLAISTTDILERAHDRIAAPGDVFSRFAAQTMSGYVTDPAVSSAERDQRVTEFARKFTEAMAMARPVVGVDGQMVQSIHGAGLQYSYTFSAIPFGGADLVAQTIQGRIQGDPLNSPTTLQAFAGKLSTDNADKGTVSKIDIFGTHPKYSSLCFTSVLEPVKARWASSSSDYQGQLWLWKRTRPLHASLAMSPEESVKVVAGWFLGRILGLVRQDNVDAPEVCSTTGWLRFGPMLRSREVGVRDQRDVLPNLLMAHAWALVRCSGDVQLTPLAPYEALRRLIDTTGSGAQPPYVGQLAGTLLLAQALRGEPLRLIGVSGTGVEDDLVGDSPIPPLADLGGAPAAQEGVSAPPWMRQAGQATAAALQPADRRQIIEARRDVMLDYLAQGRGSLFRQEYVAEGGEGYISRVPRLATLPQAPLWVETAPLALQALDLLGAMTLEAFEIVTKTENSDYNRQDDPGQEQTVWS